jgi:hypothetical protein
LNKGNFESSYIGGEFTSLNRFVTLYLRIGKPEPISQACGEKSCYYPDILLKLQLTFEAIVVLGIEEMQILRFTGKLQVHIRLDLHCTRHANSKNCIFGPEVSMNQGVGSQLLDHFDFKFDMTILFSYDNMFGAQA